ncbi:MAG: sulfatase-like hydrolase/transferase [Bacteroidales bacterium]|nr:sulfatase-like hydrolase/transferase [Candidatus Sodaliphilus fimicaballi]
MKLSNKFKDFIFNPVTLFWTFLAMLVVPNFVMFSTESTGTLTRIVQILLPLSIYWFLMTLNNKPGKMFWWLFLFIFIDAFQIVLLYLFGESPIAVDMFLNVVTTNATEVDELLGNLIPAVSTVFIIYGGGIVISLMSLKTSAKLGKIFIDTQRKLSLLLFIPSIILLGVNYFVDDKFAAEDDIFPINGCYNLGLSVDRYIDGVNYEKTSSGFKFNATCERPDSLPEVYVMVIGETVRACNMGVYGYNRNTTPHLSRMGNQLAIFRDAITMSNTTHKSVPLLLTAVGSEKFDSLYTQRGIFTAFNEVGYKTAFYSNQRRNGSFIDYLGSEAQEVVFAMDSVSVGQNQSDDVLLNLFEQRIKNYKGEKLFIVLHCYGSHFTYTDRYPAEASFFKPDNIASAKREYRPNMINAYDNTIRYTDQFLWKITNTLESLGVASVMLYTSDHGEDIFDDNRNRFLHASPIPTYYQLRVPFMLWSSPSYIEQHPDKWNTVMAHRNVAVSTSLLAFHTLLDMAGVKANVMKPSLALSNVSFKVVPRLYVNDHNKYLPMDDAGLKQLDIDQFKNNNMVYP